MFHNQTFKILSNLILLTLIFSATGVTPAHAAGILYAIPDGEGNCSSWANACTLQTALNVAVSGDEIWVSAGTYKPTTTTDRTVSFVLKNNVAVYGGFAGTETLRAQRDPALNVSILSGDIGTVDVVTDNSYHVVVVSGTDNTAVLDGFTITAGNASGGDIATGWGGGMLNVSGSPTLSNLVFNKNTAGAGGGMGNSNSNGLLMSSIVFSENNGHNGGAIHNEYSSVTFSNVAFNENVAGGNGGAIDSVSSTIILADATFTNNVNNHAPGAGNGGGMLSSLSTVTLTNVVFDGNTTNGSGGGMISYTSVVSLTNVLFKGNTAIDLGGGMRNYSCNNVTLNKVTFSGNAAGGGGGMHNVWSSPILTNVTFAENTAAQGGGLFNDSSNPNLNNVTFSANTATDGTGSEMYNFSNSHPVINNGILWGTNSVIYNYPNSPFSSAVIKDSVIQGGCPSGNTCTNVINADPKLGGLADNGGFTQTMALGIGSSAIDAGGVNTTCATTDQRGEARRGICDIGAFEYIPNSNTPATVTTITADTPDPSYPGRSINVSVAVEGSGDTPTGIVNIVGARTNCNIILVSGSGNCNVSFNTTGTKTLTALYASNSIYAGSSDTETHQVNITTRYAKPDGMTDGLCDSWINACELRYVLSSAVPGDEIWVKAGVYLPGALRTDTFQLKSGVAVYGGFAGTETARDQRNPQANMTILSGDIDNNDSQTPIITDLATVTGNTTNSYHVVTGATGATLDGFTITAG